MLLPVEAFHDEATNTIYTTEAVVSEKAELASFTNNNVYIYKELTAAKSNDPINCGFPRCPKHGVLLSVFGCKICNDVI